jgi:hypothetical protein
VLFPIVIFSQGYVIKKGHFFKHFFYIALFGLLGSMLTFMIVYGCNTFFDAVGGVEVDGVVFHLSTYQLFIFSAVMTSSEPMIAKVFVESNEYPKLYNVLYGECNQLY